MQEKRYNVKVTVISIKHAFKKISRIKGLRSKNLLGFGDSKLFETCDGFYREADAKVTKEAYKFAARRRNELIIQFYGWKRELFRTAELEKSKELWDRVKREMNRKYG